MLALYISTEDLLKAAATILPVIPSNYGPRGAYYEKSEIDPTYKIFA